MNQRSAMYLGVTLAAFAALTARAAEPTQAPETLSFNRHIRPILSDKCFACHGPDSHARKGDLRLDRPQPDGTVQSIIVAGNPEASELVKRILSTDPEEQMPPPSQEKQLTPAQKELLATWIAQGAPYEAHWSYIPPVLNAANMPENLGLVENPVDAFVGRKLDREGVAAMGEADKTTLVRRLYWDRSLHVACALRMLVCRCDGLHRRRPVWTRFRNGGICPDANRSSHPMDARTSNPAGDNDCCLNLAIRGAG